MMTKPDGSPMTKQEAIATNILNLAMKGDVLAQDTHNFNKGNEQGQELMERSFKEMGAGRSILIDRNGHIIAGNKSQKAAIAAGIKKVRVIETTGDVRAPFTQGGGLRRGCGKMVGYLGKILAKKSVQVWPMVN